MLNYLKYAFVFNLLLLSSAACASELFYSPGLCDPQYLKITAENKTSDVQGFWIQTHINQDLQEFAFEVQPKAKFTLAGTPFFKDRSAFSVKAWQKNGITVSVNCEETIQLTLGNLASSHVVHRFSTPVKTIKTYLVNLFLQTNNIKLKAYNSSGIFLGERQVSLQKYYETTTFKWSLSQPVARVEIEGENRLHSVLLYDDNGIEKAAKGLVPTPAPLNADPNKTYFLISTKEARPEDGFVIGLDDPKLIATARDQIKFKDLEKIVVAGIELGNGGFNRDFYSRDRAPYSWSVNRVDGFADFAYIDCDGSPDLTEERLMQKLSEGGRICFWRYRVTRELSLQEINSGKLLP